MIEEEGFYDWGQHVKGEVGVLEKREEEGESHRDTEEDVDEKTLMKERKLASDKPDIDAMTGSTNQIFSNSSSNLISPLNLSVKLNKST